MKPASYTTTLGLVFMFLASGPLGSAESPQQLSIAPGVESGDFDISWEALAGRTYFIQYSSGLMSWSYFPVIEIGDTTRTWGFSSNEDAFFVRLRHTDIPTDDPWLDDFDDDGVSNWDELQAGLDPFSNVDSRGVGMSDDWQMFHFGHLTADPDGYENDGTLTNREQAELGLDPFVDEAGDTASRLNYTYDALGRLTAVNGVATNRSYTMDAEGNLTLSE